MSGPARSPWIKFSSKVENPRLRLFCFPYAGGSATFFRRWGPSLPADVELCPIEYPGHATRRNEPLLRRVNELVAALITDLSPELDRPYAFFGYSLGAILAFESARALVAAGKPAPCHLFVAARRAPHLPLPHHDLYQSNDDQFIDAIMQRYGGIPAEVLEEPELLAMMMPIVRADFEMYETYPFHPGPPLPCPIWGFAGQDDPTHPPAQLEPWKEQTSAECTVTTFAGDHFFIKTAQHDLLQQVAAKLAAVGSRGEWRAGS